MENPRRRQFIRNTANLFAISPFINPFSFIIQQRKINKIILRSGWSTSNIGDSASIPLMYKLIMRYMPNSEVSLWAEEVDEGVSSILDRFFTRANLIMGGIDEDGIPDTPELQTALAEADLLIYYKGSQNFIDWTGNSTHAIETRSLQYCRKQNLPYIVYGTGSIKTEALNDFRDIMNDAELGFYTLPETEDVLKDNKIKVDDLDQSPDPLLAFDFKNDAFIRNFLPENKLSERKYLLISTMFRETSSEKSGKIQELISTVVNSWISDQNKKVLVLPDSEEEKEPCKAWINSLPETLSKNIVLYEGPVVADIASSLCEKARIVLSMSHLISCFTIQSRIPLLYIPAGLRDNPYREQMMNYGLKDYILDLEKTTEDQVNNKLKDINDNYVKAMLDMKKVSESTLKDLGKCMEDVKKAVEKINPPEKQKKKKK